METRCQWQEEPQPCKRRNEGSSSKQVWSLQAVRAFLQAKSYRMNAHVLGNWGYVQEPNVSKNYVGNNNGTKTIESSPFLPQG